jgi:hypothetical protein
MEVVARLVPMSTNAKRINLRMDESPEEAICLGYANPDHFIADAKTAIANRLLANDVEGAAPAGL